MDRTNLYSQYAESNFITSNGAMGAQIFFFFNLYIFFNLNKFNSN